ncbi:MAG TPA: hypothetical protein G4O03_02875 [Dehalococcoidia bacterium]|nr:hypothetical protein [Dehalococcoidia bacterium]
MPKKPSHRRRARKKMRRPAPQPRPKEGVAASASLPKTSLPASRKGPPGFDLSYVPGDLKRIVILAGIVLVLLVVLSLVLR